MSRLARVRNSWSSFQFISFFSWDLAALRIMGESVYSRVPTMWVDCTLHLLWIWNMSSRQSPLLCLVVSLSSSSTSTSIFPPFKSPFATEWRCWIYIQSMQPNQLSLAFSSSLVQWIKVVQHFWDNNPGSRWCGCLDFTRSIFFVILAYGRGVSVDYV